MTDHHGEFRDYDSLQPILRRVADLRKLSRQEIDRLAGFTPGYAAKRLAEVPLGKLGPETLGGMAGALGVKFIAVDDAEALAKHTARGEKRQENYVRNADAEKLVVLKFTRRHMRKLAKKAAKARRELPLKKRRAMTRNARRARWHKPRLVEISAPKTEPAASGAAES